MTEELLQDLAQYKTHKDKSKFHIIFYRPQVQCDLFLSHYNLCCRISNQSYYFIDVMMSARTLIQLFRTLNPQMLQKKFRVGKVCFPWSHLTDSVFWEAEFRSIISVRTNHRAKNARHYLKNN
jgi:hypothetical protein